MWRPIARLVGGSMLVLTAIGIVFVVGLRTKSPLVLDTVSEIENLTTGMSRKIWQKISLLRDEPPRRTPRA